MNIFIETWFKIAIIIVVVSMLVVMALTNPSLRDFEDWYKNNLASELKDYYISQFDDFFDFGFKGNIGDKIITELYDVLVKNVLEKYIEYRLDNIGENVSMDRSLFFTIYKISLPGNRVVYVVGIWNSFIYCGMW